MFFLAKTVIFWPHPPLFLIRASVFNLGQHVRKMLLIRANQLYWQMQPETAQKAQISTNGWTGSLKLEPPVERGQFVHIWGGRSCQSQLTFHSLPGLWKHVFNGQIPCSFNQHLAPYCFKFFQQQLPEFISLFVLFKQDLIGQEDAQIDLHLGALSWESLLQNLMNSEI